MKPQDNYSGECSICHTYTSKKKYILCGKCSRQGRHHTEEVKKKISEAQKGKLKGPMSEEHKAKIKQNHARPWLGKKMDKEIIEARNIKIGIASRLHRETCFGECGSTWCKSKYSETKPHKILTQFLICSGFKVITEHGIGTYSVDCYLPEYNLAFEADGEYWHNMRPEYDKKRDKFILQKTGTVVIRFKAEEIMELFNNGKGKRF